MMEVLRKKDLKDWLVLAGKGLWRGKYGLQITFV